MYGLGYASVRLCRVMYRCAKLLLETVECVHRCFSFCYQNMYRIEKVCAAPLLSAVILVCMHLACSNCILCGYVFQVDDNNRLTTLVYGANVIHKREADARSTTAVCRW